MRAFYWRWFKTAFTHSLTEFVGTVDLWTGLVSAIVSVVDHYLPGLQLMQVYGWEIPLIVFAAIIALRLVLAPYWMWAEDQQNPKAAAPIVARGLLQSVMGSSPHAMTSTAKNPLPFIKLSISKRSIGSKLRLSGQISLRRSTPGLALISVRRENLEVGPGLMQFELSSRDEKVKSFQFFDDVRLAGELNYFLCFCSPDAGVVQASGDACNSWLEASEIEDRIT